MLRRHPWPAERRRKDNEMPEETCKHENEATEMLLDFVANPHHFRDERKYEVYCCRDCGRLVNYRTRGDILMTPDEIMQMFVDLHEHLIGEADEIQAQAKTLYEKLTKDLLSEMPKVKR
jgi:hypothetical protein